MIGVDARLDLAPYVGQRSATFRFGLTNAVTGEILPDLNPIRDTVPTLSHDTGRTIKRQLSGLSLGVVDSARVNVLQSRVTPFMIIGGYEYPLGRYVFSDQAGLFTTTGVISNAVLLDEMYVIDQQLEVSITSRLSGSGGSAQGVMALLSDILTPLGVSFRLESSPYTTSGNWPIGTNRGNALEGLSVDGDYFSPWFDNAGVLRFIRAFNPADAIVTFDWDVNQVVNRDNIITSSDLLSAFNRFIVVSNSTTSSDQSSTEIVGAYDVPASAPWSIANRGFVVPSVITQAVDTGAQANAIAANIGQRQTVFERFTLDTAPDPRHDSYDVIRWQGVNWLELAWSLPLIEGSTMNHTIRKAFT